MYPEIFRIGSFPINTYGVLLAVSFLCAIMVSVRLAARDGLPREKIYDLSLWMLLAGLVGSKILMLFTEPEYRADPLQLLSLDFLRSGGVWYGGLLGAVLVSYWLMRRYQLPWWKTADAFAPGIAIGNFFGRQGCFAAGCCWGKPTSLPWGVKFTEAGHEITGVPTLIFIRRSFTNHSQCCSSFYSYSGYTSANDSAVRSFLLTPCSIQSFALR
jgi:phosphatidylglycerol:prolipoprotein diacylglycerol transferase